MLLVLGCWGTAKLLRSENRAAGIVLASAGIVLFLIAYFGAFIPFVKSWQPLRFKIPFDLFLTLAAAYILAQEINGRSLTRRSYAVPIIAAFGFLAFLFNLLATETRGKMLLRTQLRPELNAIVAVDQARDACRQAECSSKNPGMKPALFMMACTYPRLSLIGPVAS